MSQLTLIRHGQTAAYSPDADRLTELGQRQARAVGSYLVTRRVRFDEVVTGTLLRQVETAQIVGEAYRAAGLPWPEARVHEPWNEYDVGTITGRFSQKLAESDPTFAKLQQAVRDNAGARDSNRYFQRMFEALMDRWVGGELAAEGVESFAGFQERVRSARNAILEQPGSRSVAVFTSGGPIGVCVQLALQAPAKVALALNYRVKNASLTEFTFSGTSRLSLDTFNSVAHLDDELMSYR
jgi:broad specificity phosphatase PhoE